eukprot:TRINITY_DN9300_c0_g1_i5.p1 TRINITY_DN9300_c0_g1~~TRINITY_DN9300_c0_g1_i5.p1  ORF type:complete len:549 (+),score=152.08 TRINITY_DN9300_c0_g1_i5:108-1754(+)
MMFRRALIQPRFFSRTAANLEIVTFPMADIGEGIKEVEVLNWFVKEGDTVEEFQKLCEIQSDKAMAEITSKYTGKITKIYTEVGDMQQVGSGLVDIDVDGGDAPEAPPAAAPASSAPASSSGGSLETVNMMEIADGISKVEVLQVFVKDGDVVSEGDNLIEIQSDKATAEIPSPFSGTVKNITAVIGEDLKIGGPICQIQAEGSSSSATTTSAPSTTTTTTTSSTATSASTTASKSSGGLFHQSEAGKKVLATPAVRRIAAEKSVDLTKVPATGKGGRVTKEDIINFLEGAAPATTTTTATSSTAPTSTAVKYTPEDRTEKIMGRTKVMVASMTESLKIPSFGAADEINLNELVKIRTMLKPVVEKRGAKLSYMPFFIKAASFALKEYPVVNSTLNSDVTELTYKGAHNIGIAMDTAQGLVVPNIKNVEQKTIFEISQELAGLQERGMSNTLTPADLQGGTFTLSNIGSIGGTYVSPIIMPPQVAIGALGKVVKVPRYNANGEIESQNILYISWTADHRVIDGATMVRFSNVWKSYLETPSKMLLDLA